MKYLPVCSGNEAATVAWHPLGWTPLAFSQIESFPRAVLAHHYPDTPLHGDFTKLRDEAWICDADLLVGGTPCQAFSVAGKQADRFFVPAATSKLTQGVWARDGAGIKPVVFFVKVPTYRKQFDFFGDINKTIKARFGENLTAAMDYALATSRPSG